MNRLKAVTFSFDDDVEQDKDICNNEKNCAKNYV